MPIIILITPVLLFQLIDMLGYEQIEVASKLIQDREEWLIWYKKYQTDPAGIRGDRNKQTQQSNNGRDNRVSHSWCRNNSMPPPLLGLEANFLADVGSCEDH